MAPAYQGPHHLDNIIYLPGQPVERLWFPALSLVQEGMLMSTYEEFQIILGVAMLIVAILNLTHKK